MSDYDKLAERCIRQTCDDLTRDVRRKWPDGVVDIRIGPTGSGICATVRQNPTDYINCRFAFGATILDCAATAERVIADIPDPSPWLDPNHEINKPAPGEDPIHDVVCIKRSYERGDISGAKALDLLREIGVNGAPWLTEAA